MGEWIKVEVRVIVVDLKGEINGENLKRKVEHQYMCQGRGVAER